MKFFELNLLVVLCAGFAVPDCAGQSTDLPDTQLLVQQGDIASQMVAGIDEFLLGQIDTSAKRRPRHWKRDFTSPESYGKSVEPNRHQLAHILGVRDPRTPFDAPELVATTSHGARVARGKGYEVFIVRWPVFEEVHGEGLLLVPTTGKPVADIVAIPDCSHTPEQLVGLTPGVPTESQFARRLAESGCRVIVPSLISRGNKFENLTYREWLYRSAFEMGRGLIGYELQKVLACVDWFKKEAAGRDTAIGIMGWGEGGLIALNAGALDPRIDAICVSGYFDNRNHLWREPIDRNVFGLLDEFGDAELASMIAPRVLIVEAAAGPEVSLPGGRGAPARTATPKLDDVRAELKRASTLLDGLRPEARSHLVVSGADGQGPYGTSDSLEKLLAALAPHAKLVKNASAPETIGEVSKAAARHDRQVAELDRHSQILLRDSLYERQKFFWSKLRYTSPKEYAESIKPLREYFYEDIVGRFDLQCLPPHPRCRKVDETDQFTRYEVVLDVFPKVIAYGLLTLPRSIKYGEKRPVVVCQHGLEGRPQDTIGKPGVDFYKAFSTKLAERGFITFAPQNPYIFGDRFRTLQRKANSLGKTLFSIIVPQHQQIVDWLKTLPNVDPERIAFYGLSYGGKTAMRVPPLVGDYCLSICSADFNDWIDKTASTHNPYSYTSGNEYEMFEFDLGNTFNYAEMAALIAPRPFMVERGHLDGVAADETVAAEYAKVRHLYAARLHLAEQTEIEWFVGPHTINGKASFDFLHNHLHWAK